MKTLFESGPMTRAEVARRLDLTKSTMTNVIGSLIAENLIRDSTVHAGRGKVGRPGDSSRPKRCRRLFHRS